MNLKELNGIALIVEDQPDVLKYLARTLAKTGLETHTAASAEEATAIVDGLTKPLTLLITDMVLPQMGGAELAELLSDKIPELRIILFSGYSDQQGMPNSLFVGHFVFMAKPFTAKQLLSQIEELISPDSRLAGQ